MALVLGRIDRLVRATKLWGRNLMNGISVLLKEAPGSTPPPCEDTQKAVCVTLCDAWALCVP